MTEIIPRLTIQQHNTLLAVIIVACVAFLFYELYKYVTKEAE